VKADSNVVHLFRLWNLKVESGILTPNAVQEDLNLDKDCFSRLRPPPRLAHHEGAADKRT